MAGKPVKNQPTKSNSQKSVKKDRVEIELKDLTKQEKQLAREVWIIIDESFHVVSRDLFTELFEKYPRIKDYFPKSFTESDWKSPRYKNHMINLFLPEIRKLISLLDDVDGARAQLERLGKWHKNLNKGIKPEDVELLRNVFLGVLRNHLGQKMTDVHTVAMDRVLQASFNIFSDQL